MNNELRLWSQDVANFYRFWERQVRRTDGDEKASEVLINDLSYTAAPSDSHIDLEAALESLIERGEKILQEGKIQPITLGVAKLRSSKSFLSKAGDIELNQENVENRGLKWLNVDDPLVESLSQKRIQSAEQYALKTGKKFDIRNLIDAPLRERSALEAIHEYGRSCLNEASRRFPRLQSTNFQLITENSDTLWANKVVTNLGQPGSFLVIVNTHPKNHYDEGYTNEMGFHEIGGHILHFTQLSANSDLKLNWPHLLTLSIHTSDAYFTEGIAQFLHGLWAKQLTPDDLGYSQLVFDDAMLRKAVIHANLMGIATKGISYRQAAERYTHYFDGKTSYLEQYFETVSQHPFYKFHKLSYFPSFYCLQPLLNLSNSKTSELLPALLTQVFDPNTLDEFCQRAHRDDSHEDRS